MATLAQNITQAISDLSSIKTAIAAKGVTIPANTPTSQLSSLIGDIPTGDDSVLKALIQRTLTSIDIPQGVTTIGKFVFFEAENLQSVTFPNSVTEIKDNAFGYTNITGITIPNSVTSIGIRAFGHCRGLTNVTLPEGLVRLNDNAFEYCNNLTTIHLPASLRYISSNAFYYCTNFENVTLAYGFKASGLTLSFSTKYSHDTILSWLNALADRTGDTAGTLTIGSTNLAKLTAEEIAIATNKNWNLA